MKSAPSNQGGLDLQMPEGVHIGIPDAAYFDARAIGSSDLKLLYWQSESWWYSSWLNARRSIKVKSARKAHFDIGHGLHDLVLLGEEHYRERFAFEPDEDAGHWLRTPMEVKRALKDLGRDTHGLVGAKLMQAAKRAGIANRIWDLAWVAYESHKRQGRPFLTEDDDMRIRQTARLILDHEELGPVMREDGLSEVAVFWRRPEDPDTLLRAKFDRLRFQRMFDLKHMGNWRGRDIDGAIADAIQDQDYGIQRRFYAEAFDRLVDFVKAGQVHGWGGNGEPVPGVASHARRLLEQIAEGGSAMSPGGTEWVWIFVQLRNDAVGSERAPVVAPRWHSPEGRIWDEAGVKIEAALETFRRLRSSFGLERPWALVTKTHRLIDSDVRSRLKKDLSNG